MTTGTREPVRLYDNRRSVVLERITGERLIRGKTRFAKFQVLQLQDHNYGKYPSYVYIKILFPHEVRETIEKGLLMIKAGVSWISGTR